jgi:hypothetical protein
MQVMVGITQNRRRRQRNDQESKNISKENNIVLFCNYWEGVLRKFQQQEESETNYQHHRQPQEEGRYPFIKQQYHYSALAAWRRGVDADKERKRRIADAEKLFDRTKTQLEDQKRTRLAEKSLSSINNNHADAAAQRALIQAAQERLDKETKRLMDAAESLKTDTLERAEEEYLNQLRLIHEDFVAQVTGNYYNSNNHNRYGNMNNQQQNTCAQQ